MKRTTRIIVNGVEYNRMEDVPEHIRDMLRDADGDGVPDIAQRGRASGEPQMHTTRREWRGRIEDAAPEVREALERMRVGFTAGRERPSGPPSDVRAHMAMFERIFETAGYANISE